MAPYRPGAKNLSVLAVENDAELERLWVILYQSHDLTLISVFLSLATVLISRFS